MTSDSTVVSLREPDPVDDPLTAVLREGARRLLAQTVEAEAEGHCHADGPWPERFGWGRLSG